MLFQLRNVVDPGFQLDAPFDEGMGVKLGGGPCVLGGRRGAAAFGFVQRRRATALPTARLERVARAKHGGPLHDVNSGSRVLLSGSNHSILKEK